MCDGTTKNNIDISLRVLEKQRNVSHFYHFHMDETNKLAYTPGGATVIEFLEDHLPTYMKTVAGEFAELFTTRIIPVEWQLQFLPTIEMLQTQQDLTVYEAKSLFKMRQSKCERFVNMLPKMIGELSSLRVMKQSSIDRVKEYDDVSYMVAKNGNDILAVLRLIEQSHLCSGITITRADIDRAENEVRSIKLMDNETIGKYTGRVTTLLKKAQALHPGTALNGPTAVYYYSFGLREHRCQAVQMKVVEWSTRYNEQQFQGIPPTVPDAHNAIRSILSNVQYVESAPPAETSLAMDRGRERGYENEQAQRTMYPPRRQRVFPPASSGRSSTYPTYPPYSNHRQTPTPTQRQKGYPHDSLYVVRRKLQRSTNASRTMTT